MFVFYDSNVETFQNGSDHPTKKKRSERNYMKLQKQILLLRLSYWIGIIIDGLVAIEMVFSFLLGNNSPFVGISASIHGGLEYQYAEGIGATFMIAWTILIYWADRSPVERRGILLLTVFPVVVGIILTQFFGVIVGVNTLSAVLMNILITPAISVLMFYSYWNAGRKIS
jgi:hypothetical protein